MSEDSVRDALDISWRCWELGRGHRGNMNVEAVGVDMGFKSVRDEIIQGQLEESLWPPGLASTS